MKKGITLGLISGAALLAFLPSVASAALTESQIQAILGLLQSFGADQAIVSNVNSSLRGVPPTVSVGSSESNTKPVFCPNFTYNLYLGLDDSETGGQVSDLQKFLAQDSSVFPEGVITGFYGPLTEQAVKRWQAKNSVVSSGSPDTTGYGVVGSRTREKMRANCGSVGAPVSAQTEATAMPTPALPSKTITVPETQTVSISEQVKCVFKGSTATQECISSSKYGYSCKGTESCTVDVKGFLRGEQLTWKSTCGGYVYTTMDGVNESAEFNCAATAQPAIQVISPNGGEQWSVGSTQTISWSGASSVGITLLAVPGTGLPSMDIGKASNNQSFAWTIPAFISPGSYLMRVCTLVGADCDATDTSDASFSIVAATQPAATLSVGNDTVNYVPAQNVKQGAQDFEIARFVFTNWLTSEDVGVSDLWLGMNGNSADVSSIKVYLDNVLHESRNISSSADLVQLFFTGGKLWNIPAYSSHVLSVKVNIIPSAIAGRTVSAGIQSLKATNVKTNQAVSVNGVPPNGNTIGNTMTIVAAPTQPSITVLSPNGGENWQVGTMQTIKWTMPSLKGRVYLQLLKSGTYIKDITYIDYYSVVDSSTQSYSWLTPSDTASGSDYKIRVAIFSSAGNITDESNAAFSIGSSQ